MNKTKLDDRIENAVNAFFETPTDPDRFALTYTGHNSALMADEISFTEKADKWLGILREVSMFGPGTFMLFYFTLAIAFFYPTLGFSYQGYVMCFFAVFLTYAGCGSIAKIKNLLVPATVIMLGLAFAFFSPLLLGRELADLYFWDSIYLFPFVLIVAKLVQSFLSNKN